MNDEEIENPIQVAADPRPSEEFTAVLAENEELKKVIRLNEAQRQLTEELTRAGARSPRLMFDAVKHELQYGDDGQLAEVPALIERLKQSFPEQFGHASVQQSIDAGAGVANRQRLTRSALAKMKPSEIAALDWAEVRRVLAG